jgi:hypothetical protein
VIRHLIFFGLCAPVAALAETPFAGTWEVQPELTTFSQRPLGLLIDRGVYKRTSCAPDDQVPADGAFHPIIGDPWVETMSVRVLDKNRVEVTQEIAGSATWRGTYNVAKDGRTMQLKFENARAAKPVSGTIEFARDGEPLENAHLVSGNWVPQKLLDLSATGRTMSIQDTENGLTMKASDGRNYDIKFDRQDYPLKGYLDGATVQVGRRAPKTLQVNGKQHGVYVEMGLGVVSDDGKTMTLGEVDWQCQSKTLWSLRKQTAP